MTTRRFTLFRWMLVTAFLSVASAADISGSWKAMTHMGGGGADAPIEATFTFLVKGQAVTGKVSSSRGEFEIIEGKLDGDSLLFHIATGDAEIRYDGLVKEEGIDFLAEFVGRGRTDHFVAERAK